MGISQSPISRRCEEVNSKVKTFPDRPFRAYCPCLWIDASELQVRRGGRVISVIIAAGANTDSRRQVLEMEIGTCEADPI